TVRPSHNPVGPFDFAGGYDERSQRRLGLGELISRGYEDAYHQFIEAEVGAYNEGRSGKFLYSRYTNPTVVSVETKLAVLDRTEAALLFSSGMGATATILMALLKAGDEVLCAAAIYGGTLHLLQDLLSRFGVVTR